MKIYNTLTRTKDEFVPIEEGKVKMYACGPTVYDFIHIGNARPLIVFDTFRRYLEWRGYEVTFVQNFTDVDDKIINRANKEGTDYMTISERYIGEFWTDAQGLGVKKATIHPRATENIDEIIDIIKALVEKGHAYQSGNDVYFATETFKEYGKLSKMSLEDLLDGASERVTLDDTKRSPADFAVWKGAKEGEPYWESPWGNGRPGWHIECSAMCRRYLGKTLDIHAGGQDLIFPHHENEIAQSECANGVPFAHYWMHNGFITINNEKMSKSLGNFFSVREVADKFGYEPIRMMMLASHYRSPLNYSYDVVEQNKAALTRLYTCLENLEFAAKNASAGKKDGEDEIIAKFAAHKEHFIAAMDDDFNTAGAMSAIFDLARDINTYVSVAAQPSKELADAALEMFNDLTGVFGLLYNRKSNDVDAEIEALIEQRQAARKARNFAEADRIRDELKAQGITLEDTPQGVRWHRD